MTKVFNIADALHSIAPGAVWRYNDEDYSTLEWMSDDMEIPSEQEVANKISELQSQYEIEQAAILQKENEQELLKQSALKKLAKLGLTEEETKAMLGL